MNAEFKKGLEGVVAGETKICFLDGANGKLLYRGFDIDELAKHSSFEETSYLLIYGKLPSKEELGEFSLNLKNERKLPEEIINFLKGLNKNSNPMDVLRTAVSMLSLYDREAQDISLKATLDKGIRLIAQIPLILAYFYRIRENRELIKPDKELSQAGNFLYMMFGKKPSKEEEKIFDICLILHAEHEFNASTFSARETISTLSDLHSAIVSAIGTLKGPLHGGANERVLTLLKNINNIENVEGYIKNALVKKEKIMGFGHRIYKTMDPRAAILKNIAKDICGKTGNMNLFNMSMRIEDAMKKLKNIHPNVDFYSASVYSSLNFPVDFFIPIFVMSRISGWVAHAIEQYSDNRIIRPVAVYNGEMNKKYILINNR